jgi:hypothetical protein
MRAPEVSVVMSVYNGEEYLREAVESVLGQTFGDFEFLIIDDGSKDKTGEMLAEYARRDARVRVVTQENRGLIASLNRGMEMARGELIARMDADDVALAERLERQVSFLREHPEVGLLGTFVENIGPRGEALGVFGPATGDRELREVMLRWNPFRHPTILMRKEIAVGVGGYRKGLRHAEEYDLWFRMAERTKIANLAEVLVRYRMHPKQVSVTNMEHQFICCRAAQVAAARRSRGLADPLDGVTEITPEFVRGLGVSDKEIRHDVSGGYCYWICTFASFRPDEALAMLGELERMRESGPVPRKYLADAYFVAARIYLRRRQLRRALGYAARGILAQPLVAGRVARMAAARRMRDMNARVMHRSPA